MTRPGQAAIVTTLRNADSRVDSFIAYHRGLGFAPLFLFFDDPGDPAIARVRSLEGVMAVPADDELRRRWRGSRVWAAQRRLRGWVDREIMARQILNVEIAIDLACERGIDWLLHLDSDELFHAPGRSVAEHFAELSAAAVCRVTYLNHEALPERVDIVDPFREVTLFKRNRRTLPGGQLDPQQTRVVSMVPQMASDYFLLYSNGKTAVRVSKDPLPTGVHGFSLPEERTLPGRLRRRLRNLAPTGGREHASASGRTITRDDPVVLHYACCGFGDFWNKYRTLGRFPDRWFERTDIAGSLGDFHLEARDVVMSGDRAAAEAFYRRRVALGDPLQIRQLLDCGVLLRIEEPARRLAESA